jgi:hypothetical protein
MLIFQKMTPCMFLMQRSNFLRPMRIILLVFITFALPWELSWANPSSSLGGPYLIGGKISSDQSDQPDENEVLKKVAEFEAFRKTRDSDGGWDSSTVTLLSEKIFHDSIAKKQNSGVPYENQYQRYNYVVQKHENEYQIRVATW